jgi:hypothetical protein
LTCSWLKDREWKLIIARTVGAYGWTVGSSTRSLNGNQQGQQHINLIQEVFPDQSTRNEINITTAPNTMTGMISNTVTVITTMKESTGKENERRDHFLGIYLILEIEGHGA